MIRVIITQIILFLLPFVGFFIYRLATEGPTGARIRDLGRVNFYLSIAGGVLVILGFIYFAVTGGESQGVYVPTQYRDGELIPGGFRPR
ncbi:DUF6111 family protein [Acuticoccus sp. M5D2P5]|uniref:DUF6111 family protein n=1 Tax=Acuticoccus kalidii TaxID=2910977 RepID=UPI001F307534|nr:DUF6111 family protein [Acuticoccus kalidii]MCF3934162.1 DUF6111 family protein [Acuticoccus kalidii]